MFAILTGLTVQWDVEEGHRMCFWKCLISRELVKWSEYWKRGTCRIHHTWSKSNSEGGYNVTMWRKVVMKKRITKCRPMSFSMNTAAGGNKMERTTNTLKSWKIFICAKLWEFIEHFDLSIERYFELNLKAWKPLSWRPENQIWEILEYSILMISNKPRLVAGGIWTAWSAYRPSWEGCPCCSFVFFAPLLQESS